MKAAIDCTDASAPAGGGKENGKKSLAAQLEELNKECVFENPRNISKRNRLLLAMVKHQEVKKEEVQDMFSKKADPLDKYYELQDQVELVKEKTELLRDIQKQASATRKGGAGEPSTN